MAFRKIIIDKKISNRLKYPSFIRIERCHKFNLAKLFKHTFIGGNLKNLIFFKSRAVDLPLEFWVVRVTDANGLHHRHTLIQAGNDCSFEFYKLRVQDKARLEAFNLHCSIDRLYCPNPKYWKRQFETIQFYFLL